MKVDSLIENNVFYLSFRLATKIAKLIIMKEEELEFDSIIFHEFYVISPVHILFTGNFDHGRICLNVTAISNHNKTISHKYIIVFFLAD